MLMMQQINTNLWDFTNVQISQNIFSYYKTAMLNKNQ